MTSQSQRAVLSAFKLQKSISHPYALMRTARIGVVNRYKYVSDSAFLILSVLLRRTTHARMSTLSVK